MKQTKYDVFISYSRKDYVDDQKNVIPGNEISKIKDALTKAGISYWFDEEGVYSGDKFTEKIVNNIESSRIFLFLSTKNACESPWTSKEIACADEFGKCIIPVRIDKTPYNKKVMFRIADLSYVDYGRNPSKGLTELINAIKFHLKKINGNINDNDSILSYDKVSEFKGSNFFDVLRAHIINKHSLKIYYKSYRASSPKEFVISPYLLKESRHRWYLIGSKPGSMEFEKIPLDRIVSLETENKIPYYDNNQVDINHYFDDTIGVSKSLKSTPEDVLFWVSKKRYKYIETKPIHSSQVVIRKTQDGGCLFKIHVVINLELFSVLMSYGADLIVVSPTKVINNIRREFKKATRIYDDETIKFEVE